MCRKSCLLALLREHIWSFACFSSLITNSVSNTLHYCIQFFKAYHMFSDRRLSFIAGNVTTGLKQTAADKYWKNKHIHHVKGVWIWSFHIFKRQLKGDWCPISTRASAEIMKLISVIRLIVMSVPELWAVFLHQASCNKMYFIHAKLLNKV